jgi:hypothetical protein
MITTDEEQKIKELKARGYSQSKIAKELNISRSTVARHWGGRKLILSDLFAVGPCRRCKTVYPMPKFLPSFHCPYCKEEFFWWKLWFRPENK